MPWWKLTQLTYISNLTDEVARIVLTIKISFFTSLKSFFYSNFNSINLNFNSNSNFFIHESFFEKDASPSTVYHRKSQAFRRLPGMRGLIRGLLWFGRPIRRLRLLSGCFMVAVCCSNREQEKEEEEAFKTLAPSAIISCSLFRRHSWSG